MTRTEALARIRDALSRLPDERVEVLADLACAWTKPSVYSILPDAEKAEIDAALDRLDRGEGVPIAEVKARLEAKLKDAGA
jgi:hypothetical protein